MAMMQTTFVRCSPIHALAANYALFIPVVFFLSSPAPFFRGLKAAIVQEPALRESVELCFVGLFEKEHMSLAEKNLGSKT